MPNYIHKPVMKAEVLQALRPRPGGHYADGTIGGGGHTEAILEASSPNGTVFGCDRDGAAVEAAGQRLARFAGRFEIRRGNFSELSGWLAPESCDGVLLDLGVSSPQLDWPERGFTFQAEGPLDMRMDDRQPLSAANLVNELAEEELARIFREYGEEPQARRIARAVAEARRSKRFETTGELARLMERLIPRRGKRRHPATKVFQALRMAVNDERRSLESGLAAAWTVLRREGRMAVITFNSFEDRLVKSFGRVHTRDYTFAGEVDVPALRRPVTPTARWVQRKAIQPSAAEVAENPRARSAQLRVLEKI